MIIRAIDPGPEQSAWCDYNGKVPVLWGRDPNIAVRLLPTYRISHVFIESVESYGMPVGREVFETVWWSGRFFEHLVDHNLDGILRVPRRHVKLHFCGSCKARDSNIITAIVDRFDPMRRYGKHGKGTTKNPGPLFGMSKDCWQALALAITAWETIIKKGES